MVEHDDWWLQLREADRDLANAREQHHRELREADRMLHAAQKEAYGDHFDQLNENAKRTIEERGHFVSIETFEPFQQQLNKFMATSGGVTKGIDRTIAWVIAGTGIFVAVATIVVAWLAVG